MKKINNIDKYNSIYANKENLTIIGNRMILSEEDVKVAIKAGGPSIVTEKTLNETWKNYCDEQEKAIQKMRALIEC